MRSRQPESRWAVVVFFLALWTCSPFAAEAARLHVIIAADRTYPGIEADMETSRDLFLTAVVRNTPQDQCAIWEINPDDQNAPRFQRFRTTIQPFGNVLSRSTMLRAIQGLRVEPDDVVLFYYCGHGAYSRTYGTYTLASGDGGQGGLYLSEIRSVIGQRRPRFGAVVLDCCNSLRPLLGEPRPSLPLVEHREDFSPLFKELFFSRPGMLSVTSSKPNEYSIIVPRTRSPRGDEVPGVALFTKLFSSEMEESMENPLGWDDLFGRVQRNLDQEFAQICNRGLIPLGNGRYVPQARQTIDYRW
ncbi:MAG: hypothetical protein ACLP7Q_06690 [Isosphaeraceae bacterium]